MRICNDFASRGHSTPIAADFSNYAADFRSKNEKIIPNHTGQYLKIPSPSNPHNTRVESVWDGTFAQALEDQFPHGSLQTEGQKRASELHVLGRRLPNLASNGTFQIQNNSWRTHCIDRTRTLGYGGHIFSRLFFCKDVHDHMQCVGTRKPTLSLEEAWCSKTSNLCLRSCLTYGQSSSQILQNRFKVGVFGPPSTSPWIPFDLAIFFQVVLDYSSSLWLQSTCMSCSHFR